LCPRFLFAGFADSLKHSDRIAAPCYPFPTRLDEGRVLERVMGAARGVRLILCLVTGGARYAG